MAAADFFEIRVTGRGGHAGLPHTAVDTVACAAELVGAIQHIVSRRIDPLRAAVVTIGSFHAGDAPNVIPGEAVLRGTSRSFDPDVRALIPKLIEEIGHGVCAAHRADFELDFTYGYKPVVNDAGATELVRSVVSGAELADLDPIMGGDDFSAYLEAAPGCYAFVGAGGEFPHHHPRFVIDERALAIGTQLHIDVARKVLG
jgi:amidohydrolase